MSERHALADHHFFGALALPIKDLLRGIRHVLLGIRNQVSCLKNRLPRSLRRLGDMLIGRIDGLAARVDRNSSLVIHRYLDPEISRDAETAAFSKLIQREEAPMLFAKIAYENLKSTTDYLCRTAEHHDRFFISEMFAALAYRKAAQAFGDTETDLEKASVLLSSLLQTGPVRTASSTNAAVSPDEDVRQLARAASFAIVLWLVVARDCTPEGEEQLLFACADLSLAIIDRIEEAGEDSAELHMLLTEHVEVV